MEVDNRIWTEGEGLTLSMITELLDNPDTVKEDLKGLTLDLTDNLFERAKEREALLARLKKVESEIKFINGNLHSCIQFGQRRLEFPDHVFYIHDREDKTVAVEFTDGKILVQEQNLTR